MLPLRAKMRLVGVLVGATAAVVVGTGSAPAATPTCTNPAVTCVTGTADDGATFKAEVPARWNGTLLLYSHGYVPPVVPNPAAEDAPNRAVADQLLAEGFALAIRRDVAHRLFWPAVMATPPEGRA